jgi:hypothetical protein
VTDRQGASGASVSGFPAPGSRVPGAPPALKRALTAADGVRSAPADTVQTTAAVAPTAPPRVSRSRFTAAAAMVGVAAGLELARLASRSGVRCYLRQVNKIG